MRELRGQAATARVSGAPATAGAPRSSSARGAAPCAARTRSRPTRRSGRRARRGARRGRRRRPSAVPEGPAVRGLPEPADPPSRSDARDGDDQHDRISRRHGRASPSTITPSSDTGMTGSPTTGSLISKVRPEPLGALDLHRAAVAFDDRLDDRESEAEAARVAAPTRLRSSEPIEDPVQVRGSDPGARVAASRSRPRARCAAHRPRSCRFPGVLDGVLDHGVKGDREPVGVARHDGIRHGVQPPAPRSRGPSMHGLHCQPADVDRRPRPAPRAQPRSRAAAAGQPVGGAASIHRRSRGVLGDGGIGACRSMSSAWPSATVIGVRSSWEASCTNRRSRSRRRTLSPRCAPLLGGGQPPPGMPHHGHEHGRHQRHLGQLVGRRFELATSR